MTTRIVAGNDSAFTYVRLKYGANPTDTVTGVIIYPDDFTFSEAGVGAMDFGAYPATQIDAVTWEALEDVGCVFLPASQYIFYADNGMLNYNERQSGVSACYWYSTAINSQAAGRTNFNTLSGVLGEAGTQYYARNFRCYVRLAQDY